MSGKVTFIGVGEGDPGLLTRQAARALGVADAIFHDAAVHPEVLGLAPDSASRHVLDRNGSAEELGRTLVAASTSGARVVRVAMGDPLVFGRADVEAKVVARAGVAIEILPGVGALEAVSAYAGLALTGRGARIVLARVVGGDEDAHDWSALARGGGTLVVLCDGASVSEVGRRLLLHGGGASSPAAIIDQPSSPTQQVRRTSLAEVPLLASTTAARTVVVVGERAVPRSELAWRDGLPLVGKRILVTRARDQGGRTVELLRARGADPVVVPTIDIGPPTDAAPLRDAIARLDRYAWVVFTSENGVRYTWDELRRQRKDARAFGALRIAAIGPGTAAALEPIGLRADLVPRVHKGEGMAEELVARLGAAKTSRVLLARAETGRDVLPAALGAIGCEVDDVAAYRTSAPPRPLLEAVAALLEAREIDAVTFTSSSTVTHLCDALAERAPELLSKATIASIGPITTETARKRGLRVDVTADEHSLGGLIASLERFFEFSTTGVRTPRR